MPQYNQQKRKNDEPPRLWFFTSILERVFMLTGVVVIGVICTLVGLFVLEEVLHPRVQRTSTYREPYPYQPPPPAPIYMPPLPPPTALAPGYPLLPNDGLLVASNDRLLSNVTHAFDAVIADEIAAAPDGRSLAYIRDRRLYLAPAWSAERWELNAPAGATMPIWGDDGNTLYFILREAAGDTVMRIDQPVERHDAEPTRLFTTAQLVAPPLIHPGTGRLILVEASAGNQTRFVTIDPACKSPRTCQDSMQAVGVFGGAVSWADVHPNGTLIVFAGRTDGQLYTLTTATGSVQYLIKDSVYKRRPAFKREGTALAYLGDSGDLWVVQLADMNAQPIGYRNISSLSWLN